MKVLFLSNLFPDAAAPIRGLDNARLLAHLRADAQIRVLALRPRPWLWPAARRFEPRSEDQWASPEFVSTPYIPKLGSRWNHRLMARALRRPLRQLRARFPFDVGLVSWLFPDGCAVAQLACELKFPFVAIAQGSDAHLYLGMAARRDAIVRAMQHAAAVVGRSADLVRRLAAAGVSTGRLHTIYNGVDLNLYAPADPKEARRELGLPLEGPLVLFVGNLLPIKNPLLLLEACAPLCRSRATPVQLVMVGEGPLRARIERTARRLGIAATVHLAGRQPPERVARYLQAADVLALSSWNEGLPNVVLEAFACGRPVVASRVGGLPEVITESWAGRLVNPGDAEAFRVALHEQLAEPPQPARLRDYATRFSWPETARAHATLLRNALAPQAVS
ncbi:MAG: glycosyltransferase [Verrucomicrobiae bacterium]|nr:glycosyltransferase [Verrucomicrobiae bacterium]MDW8309680.1 glycosyltransferase [Verrucomicrobiales bacterium]